MNAQRFYPRGIERELQQKTEAEFMRIYRQFLEASLRGFSTFNDDQLDLSGTQPELSGKFKGELMDIARKTENKARDNFSRQSEMIIGAPYYPPGTAEGILNDWHATFQDLCVSACSQQKTKMAVIVAGAKQAGWNKAQLERAISEQLPGEFRHRAELIARTELAKLNTRVTLETYKSTGIRYYKWLTTIDGRERESHAAMNGKICSVGDGDVYFEQNPERPLHPVEHQRTGGMYHGHPGTDFQCRCSMVMWDPEIDGDYEVKDSDLIEERRAAEKAEKEAQERAEAERQEKLRAEREKAAEELKTAKETAREAETERAAAEKAKREAEAAAAMAKEEARRARLEAAALRRHAEKTKKRMDHMLKKSLDAARRLSKSIKDKDADFVEYASFIHSDRRRIENSKKSKNEKEKFDKENSMAEMAVNNGHPVVFLNEKHGEDGKKNPDAIIDRLLTEFKDCKIKQLERRLGDALEQAPNAYLRINENIDTKKFYTELTKVVKNISKYIPENTKNPERTKKIKSRIQDAVVFVSCEKHFNIVRIRELL